MQADIRPGSCRLYDPDGGGIEIDGTDLRDLAIASWRSRRTDIFQDFARYDLAVRDNVAPLGAPDGLIWESLAEAGATAMTSLDTVLAKGYDDGTELSGGQWQRIAIARALCAVKQGVELTILDEPTAQLDVRGEIQFFVRKGLDTHLGVTWDSGVALSHGQWQRIALARAYMRQTPLVLVLDEPASALDAETEHALFDRYAQAARDDQRVHAGGLTILVSHRFSTVQMADLIVVIVCAKIVEYGTHEELMAGNGTYADLYTLQAASYR